MIIKFVSKSNKTDLIKLFVSRYFEECHYKHWPLAAGFYAVS